MHHALDVPGREDHRESGKHHAERAREDPVRQSDHIGGGPRRERDECGRSRPKGDRFPEANAAAGEDGWRRRAGAARRDVVEHAHEIACLLRPLVRLLQQTAHHELGQRLGAVRA